jgi:hypothetical protein
MCSTVSQCGIPASEDASIISRIIERDQIIGSQGIPSQSKASQLDTNNDHAQKYFPAIAVPL